jgi:hypothetical protein
MMILWQPHPMMLMGTIVVGLFVYFLPTLLVLTDPPSKNKNRVMRLNALGGWTGVGWLLAIVQAFRNK